MNDPSVITSTPELAAFCAEAAREAFVTVDTEFIREKTYFPQLCLVQVATTTEARAIDPLAPGIDLAPLVQLLANPAVLKVFHACRQDMEIFYHLSGTLPAPVFDTQSAAQFAGFGESVSYSEFIRKTLNIGIDKASRFTDWARRPLSDKQITYALDDVIHLRDAFLILKAQLEKSGRMQWVEDEMATLNNIATYKPDPDTVWLKLKAGNMKPKQLACLRSVARWREQEAIRKDVPRSRVVRDETLLEIASAMPHSADELHHIRGTGQINPHAAQGLLAAVEAARASPPETWPKAAARNRPDVPEDALALLQMLLSVQCHQHGILPRLVATRDEMEALIHGQTNLPCLRDWRLKIFGEAAQRLLAGKMRLAYDPLKKEAVLEKSKEDER